MEWVEVTGRSVDEAKEAALDRLGVTEGDAELMVLAEPKTGLFGRVRGEARVRARVRPAGPRAKRPRRPRDRSRAGEGSRSASGAGSHRSRGEAASGGHPAAGAADRDRTGATGGTAEPGRTSSRRRRRGGRGGSSAASGRVGESPDGASPGGRAEGSGAVVDRNGARERAAAREESTVAEGMTLQEQAEVAREFLEGLIEQYGMAATIEVRELDEETVELAASGDGLGMLVGPKGAALAALQDVTRAVVQRQFPTRTDRILVDVAGYRERRVSALRRFSQQIASEVVATGEQRALEAMSPADRKVVHDTVVEIDGASSRSEGEDPSRYVVIVPGG
ncbi:MAG: RNA-binding cell elongation regulator Jag/EloR [Acidimicrobiales bacterium]